MSDTTAKEKAKRSPEERAATRRAVQSLAQSLHAAKYTAAHPEDGTLKGRREEFKSVKAEYVGEAKKVMKFLKRTGAEISAPKKEKKAKADKAAK